MDIEKDLTTIKKEDLVIPMSVVLATDITETEKIILGLIIGECKTNKVCHLTNAQFGKILNKENRTMSRSVTKLKDLGYIISTESVKGSTRAIEIIEEKCYDYSRFEEIKQFDKEYYEKCLHCDKYADFNVKI